MKARYLNLILNSVNPMINTPQTKDTQLYAKSQALEL
jgi:hypothetical protein